MKGCFGQRCAMVARRNSGRLWARALLPVMLLTGVMLGSWPVAVASAGTSVPAEFQLGFGVSGDPMQSGRLAWRSGSLPEFDWPAWTGQPRLFVEGSLTYIHDTAAAGADLTLVGLSPVLQWQLAGVERPLYIEAGIGVAAMDRRRVSGRDLGSHLQFEDMLRLSWQYRPSRPERFSLAFVHYSNGGLKGANHGVNLYQLSWIRPF